MADYNERTLRLAAELKEQALRNLGRLREHDDRQLPQGDTDPGRKGRRSA